MRQHAVSRLNCDQSYIENRGNGESGSERCRRMAMAMVVTVVMAVMVVMMMTVAMLVRLMRRHALQLSIARAHARAFSCRRATRAMRLVQWNLAWLNNVTKPKWCDRSALPRSKAAV